MGKKSYFDRLVASGGYSLHAKQAKTKASQKYVKQAIKRNNEKNTEVKHYTFTQAGVGVTTAGAIVAPLQGINQGVNHDERVGCTIKLLSHRLNVSWDLGDAVNNVRWLMLYTYSPVTSISDIFNNLALMDVNATLDRRVVSRVLLDKRMSVNSFYSGQRTTKIAEDYRKDTKKIIYEEDGTNVPSRGHFYIVYLSDSAITPNPTIRYSYVARYTDA